MTRTIVRADGSEFTLPEARELTPQEAQERAELCAVLDQQVRDAVRDVRRAWWLLAKALFEFREAHAWSTLGYDTVDDYLHDPAVDVSKSTFYALTRAYEQFARRGVESSRLDSLDWAKVHEVVPALVAARVTVDEALADAGSLSLRELRVKYGDQRAESPRGDKPPKLLIDKDTLLGPDGKPVLVDGRTVRADQVRPAGPTLNLSALVEDDEWSEEVALAEVRRACATGERCPRVDRRALMRLCEPDGKVLR